MAKKTFSTGKTKVYRAPTYSTRPSTLGGKSPTNAAWSKKIALESRIRNLQSQFPVPTVTGPNKNWFRNLFGGNGQVSTSPGLGGFGTLNPSTGGFTGPGGTSPVNPPSRGKPAPGIEGKQGVTQGGGPPGYDDILAQLEEILGADLGGEMPAPPEIPFTGGGPARIPTALQSALDVDSTRMQEAADRQYARNNERIGAYGRFLDDDLGTLGDRLTAGLEPFDRVADSLESMGQGTGAPEYARGVHRDMMDASDEVDRDLRGAMRDAGGAVRAAEGAADEYAGNIAKMNGYVAEDAAAIAGAIHRDAQNAIKMARTGMHPDGTPMTAAERTDVMLRVHGEVQGRVTEAVQPIYSRWHQIQADMRGQLAQLRQSVSQMKAAKAQLGLGAAQQRGAMAGATAQTGLAAAEIEQRDAELRRTWSEASANIRQMKEQLRQAALFQAAALEAEGLSSMAELVKNNPETVISRFQGMLAIYAAASAASGTGFVQ